MWILKVIAASTFAAISFLRAAQAYPASSTFGHFEYACGPVSGNILVNQYQLYPENLDFDFKRCIIYYGYVIANLTLQSLLSDQIQCPLQLLHNSLLALHSNHDVYNLHSKHNV
jgi:hypothetical protein